MCCFQDSPCPVLLTADKHTHRGPISSVEGGGFKGYTLIYKIAEVELVAQTLEKYQYLFTYDLHLLHSCCSEGHFAEPQARNVYYEIKTLILA